MRYKHKHGHHTHRIILPQASVRDINVTRVRATNLQENFYKKWLTPSVGKKSARHLLNLLKFKKRKPINPEELARSIHYYSSFLEQLKELRTAVANHIRANELAKVPIPRDDKKFLHELNEDVHHWNHFLSNIRN